MGQSQIFCKICRERAIIHGTARYPMHRIRTCGVVGQSGQPSMSIFELEESGFRSKKIAPCRNKTKDASKPKIDRVLLRIKNPFYNSMTCAEL
jgi:hypothetical protein